MPGPAHHVVVSPHFDDAVLSCAHVLDGPRAAVLTVCAGAPPEGTPVSGWDAACGFASGVEAARVRTQEDDAACALAGVTAVRLPFLDGAYAPLPAPGELRAAVAPLLGPGATVWLPAAIGGQQDHRAVRDALLPLLASEPVEGRLYADSPYAAVAGWDSPDDERPKDMRWATALEEAAAAGLRVGPERRERLEGPALDRKLGLVRCHASQLAQLGGVFPGLSGRTGPLATEVDWPVQVARRPRWSLRFRR